MLAGLMRSRREPEKVQECDGLQLRNATAHFPWSNSSSILAEL